MISIYQPFDVTARALIEFYALSGADINKFNVRKGQSISLAGIQQCWRLYPRSILILNITFNCEQMASNMMLSK